MKKVNALILFSLFLVLLILFSWKSFSSPENNLKVISTDLPCLVPNLDLAMHIHQKLEIIVDSKEETIPAEIGLEGTCHRPIHTHETNGEIHIESQIIKDYTLGDFFTIWGKLIQRDGHTTTMIVDDQPSLEFEKLILKDDQKIKLIYTSAEGGSFSGGKIK